MNKFRIGLLVLGLLLSSLTTAVVSAQTGPSDPVSIANTLASDLNAEKSEEALALFSEDAVITAPLVAGSPFVGKAQIRNFIQDARGRHQFNQIVGTPEVTGDKATATVHVADDRYRKIGLEFVEFKAELVVQNGKIKTYTATFAPSELAKLKEATARAAVPQATPQTGLGGRSADGDSGLLLWLLLLLAALGATGSGLLVRNHRQSRK